MTEPSKRQNAAAAVSVSLFRASCLFRISHFGFRVFIPTLLVLATLGPSAFAASSNSLMAISTDGALLACSNRDSGAVTIVRLGDHTKLHEVNVGHKPEGVTFLGDTHNLAVAIYADDKVVFVDGDAGTILGEIDVFDEPYGVVSNAKGDRVYVTLSYPGQVVEIDAASRKVLRTFDAGPFARGIAITHDGKRLFVTEYYTAVVHAIDIDSGKQVDQWDAIASENLSRQITLHPTRPKAYLPHIRSRITAAHGEGSIFPYVTMLDTDNRDGKRRRRVPMDAFIGNRVTANPWEVAVAPDGQRAYAVFSGTNDMFVCKVLDDDYRELEYIATIQLGNNPRAVRVAPDGDRFYVYNALDFQVVVYDAKSLRAQKTIDVTDNPLGEQVLLGKRLFYSALQPMVGRRWISCSSCHPDGESDARTWQNPEGLRDTPSLAGMAATHPLHWSADRDEVQDFEHTIRGQLMQGRGLIRGKVNPSLEAPNAGLSRELDALAAYSNTHTFTLSPHAKHGLTDAAKRGQKIFHSAQTACANCHTGPYYTDSVTGNKIITHNIGTGDDDPSELMGPAYDTPTLLGVYRTAPYLHHGKAKTLRDVLTTQNKNDRHGRTSHLTDRELDDLAEFLKALPFELPEPGS